MKLVRFITKPLPVLFFIGAIAFFAILSPQVASAKVMKPATGCSEANCVDRTTSGKITKTATTCSGVGCYEQDPTTMHCLSSVHILPYKMPEYYQGILVGYFSSVYSNTCNSNWNEAELTPYAISQGWRVSTTISTVDSNNQQESISFPPQSMTGIPANGAGQVTSGNSASRVAPGNGAGQVVPDNGAGRIRIAGYESKICSKY